MRQASKKSDVYEGLDIIRGPLVQGFLLPTGPKAVVLLDEFLPVSLPRRSFPLHTYRSRCWQVYLYPSNVVTQAGFAKVSSALSSPSRTNVEGRQRIQGHQILVNSDLGDNPVAYT
jgi:hypothetical protein